MLDSCVFSPIFEFWNPENGTIIANPLQLFNSTHARAKSDRMTLALTNFGFPIWPIAFVCQQTSPIERLNVGVEATFLSDWA